jgi:hypothetical protein
MEPEYPQRVKEEKKELDEKMIKLTNFLTTVEFMALPIDERKRLRKQNLIMSKYSEILEERILHFPVTQ